MATPPDALSPHRRWIADVLAAAAPRIDVAGGVDEVRALVDAVARERVTALVAAAVLERTAPAARVGGVGELGERLAVRARSVAGLELARHAELTRVLAMLEDARIEVLLLKGTALAYWLYPAPHLRECGDLDLLFESRAEAERAATLLEEVGYELVYVPGELSYEMPCRRAGGVGLGVEVDMHWKLVNAPVFADVLTFEELYSTSIPVPRVAPSARGLSPVHALLHAAINRAMNLHTGVGDRLVWLYDVHLLARELQPDGWQELVALCKARGMSGVCDEALCAAEAAFGAGAPAKVRTALWEQRTREALDARRLSDWRYMQTRNLAALPDARTRARWLWQRAAPSREQLRARYGANEDQWRLLWRRLQGGLRKLRG